MAIETEAAARDWFSDTLNVSRETLAMLDDFAAFLRHEATLQNLIAPSTLETVWSRHFVDSAQLLTLLPSQLRAEEGGRWLDLGTGAGFPGLIVAMVSPWRVTLVESRRKRCDYLARAIERYGFGDRTVLIPSSLERVTPFAAQVITARAFAPLAKTLSLSQEFSTEKTHWLLPKGKSARSELASLPSPWHDMFHVEQSLTDSDAAILVGRGRAKH